MRPDIDYQEIPLPDYLPPDTLKVSTWLGALEAFRSSKLLMEPRLFPELNGGTFISMDGREHIVRRRLFNALVRPSAIEYYCESVIPAAIHSVMAEVLANPRPDGLHEADLLEILHKIFITLAAVMGGLEGVTSVEGREELRQLDSAYHQGVHAKWLSSSKRAEAVTKALAAKKEYQERFFAPSCAARKVDLASAEGGEVTTADRPACAIALMARDPHYEDHEDLMLVETLAIFDAAVNTSTQNLANTIDELADWFDAQPEDYSLRCDTEFLSGAIWEALRLHTNGPVAVRVAAEDFESSTGEKVSKGQSVTIFHRRANRDQAIYGADANSFNPRRYQTLPPDIPAYGMAFGGGAHMCLGQRLIIGNDGTNGASILILRALFESGIRLDPEQPPKRMDAYRDPFVTYPVIFSDPAKKGAKGPWSP